jgi:cyanophycin synthetase
MTTTLPPRTEQRSFREWASTARKSGLDPIILVVGTRGKSTIARLLDAIARDAGLSTALRTDSGVEIEGRRQLGDIHPLVEALEELDSTELDLAIIEMGWGELQTLPLGDRQPAAVIVSTICPHKEYCQLAETRRAIASLKALLLSTPQATMIAADIDDSAFPSLNDAQFGNVVLTSASSEHPFLRRFRGQGGLAAWTSESELVVSANGDTCLRMPIRDIPLTIEGAVLFQMRNVMLAAATGFAIGLPETSIRRGLMRVHPDHANLPTSFNELTADGIRVIIDRPSPSWFIGPLLRATRSLRPQRQIFVVDYRDVNNHDDSVEVGRMLGRNASMCVMIDDDKSLASVVAIKAGIAKNEVPPPIAHAESLPKAVLRALASAHEGDVVVVLTMRAQTVYRTLARHRVV